MQTRDSTDRAKTCPRCGRDFQWRKKWAKTWAQVLYCSERCRRTPLRSLDRELERDILRLLGERKGTICPSEPARHVARAQHPSSAAEDEWRLLMEPSRAAARRLCAQGLVVILQRGHRVNPSTAKGPIRIGRGPEFSLSTNGQGAKASKPNQR